MQILQRAAHNRAVSSLSVTVDCFSSRFYDVKKFGWRSQGSALRTCDTLATSLRIRNRSLTAAALQDRNARCPAVSGGGKENNVCRLLFPVEFPH